VNPLMLDTPMNGIDEDCNGMDCFIMTAVF